MTAATVTCAMDRLAAGCAACGRLLPDVLLVLVAEDHLDLILRTGDTDPPAPFTAISPERWRIETGHANVAAADGVASTTPQPYPALVTLGATGDALVLLNLEAVGSLRVHGDPENAAAALRALALDLSVGPISGAATLALGDPFGDLADVLDPTRTRRLRMAPGTQVSAQVEDAARVLRASGATDVRDARSRRLATDATTPEVILTGTPIGLTPAAWSGVVTVDTAKVSSEEDAGEGAVLRVTADGHARLDPPGITLIPQLLVEEHYAQVLDLLRTTCAPTTAPPAAKDAAPSPPTGGEDAEVREGPGSTLEVGSTARSRDVGTPAPTDGVDSARLVTGDHLIEPPVVLTRGTDDGLA